MESLKVRLQKSIVHLDKTIADLQNQRDEFQNQLDIINTLCTSSSTEDFNSDLLNHQNVNPSSFLENKSLGNNLVNESNSNNNIITTNSITSISSSSSSSQENSSSVVLNNNNNHNNNKESFPCIQEWENESVSPVECQHVTCGNYYTHTLNPHYENNHPFSAATATTNTNIKRTRKQDLDIRSFPSTNNNSKTQPSSSSPEVKKPKVETATTSTSKELVKEDEVLEVLIIDSEHEENELFDVPADIEDFFDDDSSSNNNNSDLQTMTMDLQPGIDKRKLMNQQRKLKGLPPLSFQSDDYSVCKPEVNPFDEEEDEDKLLTWNVLLLSILIYKAKVKFFINGHVCTTSDAQCLRNSIRICGTIREIRADMGGRSVSFMTTEFSLKIILVDPQLPIRTARKLVRKGILIKSPENSAAKCVSHMASPKLHFEFNEQVLLIVKKQLARALKLPEIQAEVARQEEMLVGVAPSAGLRDSDYFGQMGNKMTVTVNVGRMNGKIGGPSKTTGYKHVKYTETRNVGVHQFVHPVSGRMVKYETREDGKKRCPKCNNFVDHIHHHKCGPEQDTKIIMPVTEEYKNSDFECLVCHRHFISEFFLLKHKQECKSKLTK